MVGVEPGAEEHEGPAGLLLGPDQVDDLLAAELVALVLLAVGDGDEQDLLGGVAGSSQGGGAAGSPADEPARAVEQRRPAARLEGVVVEGHDLGDRDGVGEHLQRVLAVELDQRHPGVVAVGLLLGQQVVEARDDLLGHGSHGAGPVEQDEEVDDGHGRAHESSFTGEVDGSTAASDRQTRC